MYYIYNIYMYYIIYIYYILYYIYMYSSIGYWDHPHNHCESTRQPVGEIARCRPASGMAVSAIVICGSGDIGSYLILHCILYIY